MGMAVLRTARLLHLPILAITLAGRLRKVNRFGDAIVALEMVVLSALCTMVPPLVALGVYLNAFHYLRYALRFTRFAPQALKEYFPSIPTIFTSLVFMFTGVCVVKDLLDSG